MKKKLEQLQKDNNQVQRIDDYLSVATPASELGKVTKFDTKSIKGFNDQ